MGRLALSKVKRLTPLLVFFALACDATKPNPSITLTLGGQTVTLTQGQNSTVTITVNRVEFTGNVDLAATGLPTGVTATFTPASVPNGTTSSTLTLAANSTATPGAATVTVTASGTGVESKTATLALTVNVAGTYTLAASPTSVTLNQGATGTSTVNITRTGGFAQAVTLAASGLPTGVTAAFNPAAASGTSSTLTFTATATATAGTSTVTITGTTPGLSNQTTTVSLTVQPPPSITVALSASTLAVTQGQSGTLTVTISRTNFTGAVDLAATGLPSGVTASFNPASVASGSTTSTLTVTASSSAAPSTATITVTGSGTGVSSATATFALTVNVAGSYTLGVSPTSVILSQGSSQTATVNITRSGGFSGTVTLAASGLPNGVTASFSPSAATGTSSTLTLTATSSATTGTVSVTITGTTPGLSNQTTTLSLTVQAPGSTTSISIDFCSDDLPIWFAYQNEGAAWTRVTADANGTFTFNATSKVGIAGVTTSQSGTTYEPFVVYATVTDLQPSSGVACIEEQGTKTLNGSVASLATNEDASIAMAGAFAFATPSQLSFTLSNLPSGALDLIAIRSTSQTTGPSIPNRLIMRRGLNMTSGSTIPVLDFGASEAVALATASFTASGLNSSEQNSVFTSFATSAGTFAFIASSTLSGTSATGTFYAVPSSLTLSGDLHSLFLFGGPQDFATFRGAGTFFRNASDKSLSLGAVLTTPTFTQVATSPYVRFRAQLASQADYNGFVEFEFDQANRNFFLGATANYFGSLPTTWDLTMPDFSTVSGWDNTWGLQAGQSTDLEAFAEGGASSIIGEGGEGQTIKQAGRGSTVSTVQMWRMANDGIGRSRFPWSLSGFRSRNGRMK